MQKSPPLGGERKLLEDERREGRRDVLCNNRFSVLMDMDSEKLVTADKYGEEEADSTKRGEFRDRSPLGQSQRDTAGRRRKREEESAENREERGKMEVEEGEAIDTDEEKSSEECAGTQKSMASVGKINIERNKKKKQRVK